MTNILNSGNKFSTQGQEDLAIYGITRQKAIEGSANLSDADGPKYFGIAHDGKEYRLSFPKDISNLDKDMNLAIVAPDNQAFDLLAPKDFVKGLSFKDEKGLRKYLRKLLDTL